MKKRYLILAGILAASMLAAGWKEELCGTGAEGGGNGNPDGNGSCENGCGGDADLYG